jgi:hypothetical protein
MLRASSRQGSLATTLFGDGQAFACTAFHGLWHCLRMVDLFIFMEASD